MSNILQVGLFNAEASSSKALSRQIRSLNLIQLVSEVGNEKDLAHLLENSSIQVMFFHLDPNQAKIIELIEQVARRHPDVAMIALSDEMGPEAILAPIRAGCDQYVCEPINPEDLASAVARVVSKRFQTQSTSRCICVTGASGGAGATSIASNLAMEIGQITGKPVWAAISAGGIVGLELPDLPLAEHITIAADNDIAGLQAAERAAAKWIQEGRTVEIATPPQPGADWNDALQKDASWAA